MKPRGWLLLACLGVGSIAPACRASKREAPAASPPSPVAPAQDPRILKIWVSKDGVIQVDGKVVELAAVDAILEGVAKREGFVFYGRDAAREDPHPNGMKVVEMIAKRRLPVRLSSKPDFSDAVGPQQ